MSTNGGSATRDAAARRRRITERGAERLALITGRAQSLSSSSSLPPSVAHSEPSSTTPCPTSVSPTSDQLPLADENTGSLLDTDIASNDVASDVRSVIDNANAITGTFVQTPSNSETIAEQTPLISTTNKSKKPESQTRHYKTFSPMQLRPAITASENIRIICSITVALLVMLADAGFPILGSDSMKSIILCRPLLLLLLTNVTIVAAYFLLQKVKHRSTGEASFADHIGTVLEWGLLMKTVLSAFFMDCSIYSVVVICGMRLLQSFRG